MFRRFLVLLLALPLLAPSLGCGGNNKGEINPTIKGGGDPNLKPTSPAGLPGAKTKAKPE
jgi:hypothetical protein